MADYLDRAHETLRTVPDFSILSDIAARLGTSFAIRGGVPRNLLARAVRDEEIAVRSLTDLVDPFSDIDLVVPDPAMATALLFKVHSAIALAGFFRWELKARGYVERCVETEPRTTLDGVEIVFRPGKLPELANHETAARDLATGHLLPILPSGWFRRERRFRPMDSDIFALRAARFAAQFELQFPVSILGELSARREDEQELEISAYTKAMFDFAALDVLFTASTRRMAVGWLAEIETHLASDTARQSVSMARNLAVPGQTSIHAIAYPAWGGLPPVAQPGIGGPPEDVVGREATVLPWVPVRLPRGEGDCCGRDFSLGPLAIAWRNFDDTRAEPEVELGPVILLPSNDDYPPDRFVFAAPGIVDTHRSTVMRLDWGFAQLIAGGGKTIFVGARETAQPEDGS